LYVSLNCEDRNKQQQKGFVLKKSLTYHYQKKDSKFTIKAKSIGEIIQLSKTQMKNLTFYRASTPLFCPSHNPVH